VPPNDERTASDQSREQLREFRRVTAAAVGEIRSQQIRQTYAALSIEELMDQHITRLEGTDDPIHPSRKTRLQKVYDDFTNNIQAMKDTPPDRFRRHDPDGDVNTPREGEPESSATTGSTP
jgi:hypothetical protein